MRNWINLVEQYGMDVPRYLYHGTRDKNVDSILANGLDPQYDNSWREFGQGIYLTDNLETALGYSVGECVFRIETKDLNKGLLVPDDYDLSDLFNGEAENFDIMEYGYDPEDAPTGIHECDWLDSLRIVNQCQYLGKIKPEFLTPLNYLRTIAD